MIIHVFRWRRPKRRLGIVGKRISASAVRSSRRRQRRQRELHVLRWCCLSVSEIKRTSQCLYKIHVLGSQRHPTGVNGRAIGHVEITRSMRLGRFLQGSQTLFGETFDPGGNIPSQPSHESVKRRMQHQQPDTILSAINVCQSLYTGFETHPFTLSGGVFDAGWHIF